jgi:prepilin-type N-terminal cleavage/methylation domain-containing protein
VSNFITPPRYQRGFTLIEIVLALAIAGLIMVIVLIALSGAQRARRDTERKRHLASFIGLMQDYAANNFGAVPPRTQAEADAFVGASFSAYKDPSDGNAYDVEVQDFYVAHTLDPYLGQIMFLNGHRCARPGDPPGNIADVAPGAPAPITSPIFVAVLTLESGGPYCLDNGR